MFFSFQTVVIVNTEQPVVLEITWRSNKWSVIRCHEWHPSDMWWHVMTPGGQWHVSPDEALAWWLSAVILEWQQPRPGDQSPLSRWGHYPDHYPHHRHCHLVISCHWYGTKWWASLWFSKLAHDYLQHNLRQTRTKRSLPDMESNELLRNLSVHG